MTSPAHAERRSRAWTRPQSKHAADLPACVVRLRASPPRRCAHHERIVRECMTTPLTLTEGRGLGRDRSRSTPPTCPRAWFDFAPRRLGAALTTHGHERTRARAP